MAASSCSSSSSSETVVATSSTHFTPTNTQCLLPNNAQSFHKFMLARRPGLSMTFEELPLESAK